MAVCLHTHVDLGWRSSGASLRQQQPPFSPGEFCREGVIAQQPGYPRHRLMGGTQAERDSFHAYMCVCNAKIAENQSLLATI